MQINLGKTQNYLEWLKKVLHLDYCASNSKSKNIRIVKRGQVYFCDLGIGIGSEETKDRPCLVIQNDSGNISSPNTIVAPITNQIGVPSVTVPISSTYSYVDKDGSQKNLTGYILLGNIVTVSKIRLGDFICDINSEMNDVNSKILTSLGMYSEFKKLKDTINKDKLYIKKINQELYDLKNNSKKY